MTTHTGQMFDTEELVINMGPQHPSTHGVLRVVLKLDGEKVVSSDVVIGYLHRGIDEQRRLLPDGREADAGRGASACALHPHRDLRAAADREPLSVARHARD